MDAGDRFPEFRLPCAGSGSFDGAGLSGLRRVVFFCPPGGEPALAEAFGALRPRFMMRNVPVIGVSGESPRRLAELIGDRPPGIVMLSDGDGSLARGAGAWEGGGIAEATFIVGRDGLVEAAWRGAQGPGHAERVLERAISLSKR
ncbi:MAG: redoxin domain-containing protein [Candidatus Methanoplasma sp.]|jgi:peroxiredoxin Q/BCP|nr:redoxin domain-containing protein [Candidatus Methanoplasma sp.]